MKYVFNRERNGIENWDKINGELACTLDEIREGNDSKEEMKLFLLKVVEDAFVSEKKKMAFWNYDDPNAMPADARCDYVYRPTYLMTLAMVGIINRYAEFMDLAGVRETLHYALNACADRDLCGSGYEAYEVLCDNVLLFMRNGIVKFMKDWPLFSIRFEEVFRNALNGIERDFRAGKHKQDAWGRDCRDVQEEIVRLREEMIRV